MNNLAIKFKYIIISLLIYSEGRFESDLSKIEKEGALEVASTYAVLLTRYGNCGDPIEGDKKYAELNKLFTSLDNFTSVHHANDLLKGENINSFDEYLNLIEENYNYRIYFDFGKPELLNCHEIIGSKKLAYVGMKKSIIFENNAAKNVYIILAINVQSLNFKIDQVFFKSEYDDKNGTCQFNKRNKDDDNIYKQYFYSAEKYFDKKDFTNALSAYESASKYKREDMYIMSRIEACKILITTENLKQQAEVYYMKQDYYSARDLFQRLLKTNHREIALRRISECNYAITEKKYSQLIGSANDYYKKEFWAKAIEVYQECLKIKPNESFVINRINECKSKDPIVVNKIISEAIILAERKGKLAEAFKLLYSVESSKMLDGENYYFMAMMMDGREDNVVELMGFKKNYCYHLAVVYCKKAINLGNQNAMLMWLNIFNKSNRSK